MVQNMSIGETQEKICISIDIKNDELPTLFVKNLKTGKFYYEQIKLGSSGEFVNNDDHLVYVKKDSHSYRDCKLVLHQVGDRFLEQDLTIFEELDEQNWLNLELSSCKNWLHLIQVSKDGYGHFLCKKDVFDQLKTHSSQDLAEVFKSSFVKIADKADGIREIKINETGIVLQKSNDSIHFLTLENLEKIYSENLTISSDGVES